MTTTASAVREGTIPLAEVERQLAQRLATVKDPDESPVQRAHMSNLVIFTNSSEFADSMTAEVPTIVASHPARVLLLVGEPGGTSGEVRAAITTWCQRQGSVKVCSEQVTLYAQGPGVERLAFAVRALLIGDLPTNLWWAAPVPPPLTGPLLFDLAEQVQQVIYDSIGWLEPARGVAATASWLEKFEHSEPHGHWRVASDLNWRRLKYWRRLLSQALDPAVAPGALESISEVLVEHGPHAVVQAWELVSWLTSRLGWRVLTGRASPGVELSWRCYAEHGELRVRIRRLPEGPATLRRVRIACKLEGQPGALDVQVQDERHLAVVLEGVEAAPRTVTVQPQPLADLVARQLSDRERAPVFHESMGVAQILARSVLR
jgi:glucose-6-phosphate dehydrogenase assembly protein OpcA